MRTVIQIIAHFVKMEGLGRMGLKNTNLIRDKKIRVSELLFHTDDMNASYLGQKRYGESTLPWRLIFTSKHFFKKWIEVLGPDQKTNQCGHFMKETRQKVSIRLCNNKSNT